MANENLQTNPKSDEQWVATRARQAQKQGNQNKIEIRQTMTLYRLGNDWKLNTVHIHRHLKSK